MDSGHFITFPMEFFSMRSQLKGAVAPSLDISKIFLKISKAPPRGFKLIKTNKIKIDKVENA